MIIASLSVRIQSIAAIEIIWGIPVQWPNLWWTRYQVCNIFIVGPIDLVQILLILAWIIQTLSVVKSACLGAILRNVRFTKSKIGSDVLVCRSASCGLFISDDWRGYIQSFATTTVCLVDVLARCLAALLRSKWVRILLFTSDCVLWLSFSNFELVSWPLMTRVVRPSERVNKIIGVACISQCLITIVRPNHSGFLGYLHHMGNVSLCPRHYRLFIRIGHCLFFKNDGFTFFSLLSKLIRM